MHVDSLGAGMIAGTSFLVGCFRTRQSRPKEELQTKERWELILGGIKDQQGTVVDLSYGCDSTEYYTILFNNELLAPKVFVTYEMPPWRDHPWQVGDKIWVSGGKLFAHDATIEYFGPSFRG
ncbi:MAG: hypothetical protein JWN50_771 [Parcubacteria group bacterium]|nr:hypothetical protein [Parcubacteria group bacterium]